MSVELLKELMETHGFSQVQVAAQLGKSSAVVNQYLQGKYKGDIEAVERAIEQLSERLKTKRQNDLKQEFVETDTAVKVLNLCAMAHSLGDIYLLIGEAGLGKTVALKHYTGKHEGVLMLEVDPTYSPKVLLQALCEALNVGQNSRSNHALFDAAVAKLDGSGRLIIVDEAELLNTRALEVLRRLHDKSGVGIVLAGMPRLRANLRGTRGEFKQLYSRIGLHLDMRHKLPDADILQLIEAGIGHNPHAEKLLAVSQGNARRLFKLLRGLKSWASRKADKAITAQMIDEFAAMLID